MRKKITEYITLVSGSMKNMMGKKRMSMKEYVRKVPGRVRRVSTQGNIFKQRTSSRQVQDLVNP